MPSRAVLGGQKIGVALFEHRVEAQVFAVVGDQQKVEGAPQLDLLAVVGGDLVAACESERVTGSQPRIARAASVRRPAAVHVGIAPEHLAWNGGGRGGRIVALRERGGQQQANNNDE